MLVLLSIALVNGIHIFMCLESRVMGCGGCEVSQLVVFGATFWVKVLKKVLRKIKEVR